MRHYDRRVFRLVHILRELSEKRRVRAAGLAQAFNVSLRTVERDLQLLRDLEPFIDYDASARTCTVPRDWVCPYCPTIRPRLTPASLDGA